MSIEIVFNWIWFAVIVVLVVLFVKFIVIGNLIERKVKGLIKRNN